LEEALDLSYDRLLEMNRTGQAYLILYPEIFRVDPLYLHFVTGKVKKKKCTNVGKYFLAKTDIKCFSCTFH